MGCVVLVLESDTQKSWSLHDAKLVSDELMILLASL